MEERSRRHLVPSRDLVQIDSLDHFDLEDSIIVNEIGKGHVC